MEAASLLFLGEYLLWGPQAETWLFLPAPVSGK